MPTVFLRDLCHCQRVIALRVKEVETSPAAVWNLVSRFQTTNLDSNLKTNRWRWIDDDEEIRWMIFLSSNCCLKMSDVLVPWSWLSCLLYLTTVLYELNKCLISRDLSCRKPGKQSSSFCALYCTVLYRRTKSCYYRKLAGLVLSSYLCFWNDPVLVRCTQRHRIRPKLRM